MRVAIVPARGGSKRVPQKNFRDLNGSPTIVRTLDILGRSRVFDRIVVSTDHPEIKRLSESVGAEVPFTRPESLADDYSTTKEVVEHAISEIGLDDPNVAVCCVYPTAVLLEPGTIRTGLELLQKNPSRFVVSVKSFEHPIGRAMSIDRDSLRPVELFNTLSRTQDCIDFVHDAGQLYWGSVASWTSTRGILDSGAVPLRLNRLAGLDVDTMEDWFLLNALIRYREADNESIK
jgi:pseudaminic acid cytidylyltransferase